MLALLHEILNLFFGRNADRSGDNIEKSENYADDYKYREKQAVFRSSEGQKQADKEKNSDTEYYIFAS